MTPDHDPLDTAFIALRERSSEPPQQLRARLSATIPPKRKNRPMLTRLTLAAAACSALGFYIFRPTPSLARPIAYTQTIQKMRELPYFHIIHRQRPEIEGKLGPWLTREVWLDRERGLRIGPLSGTALPDEHLLLPDDTDYWKNGDQVMTLHGKGAWQWTYQEQLRSVQDFPTDLLQKQASPAQAIEGKWQGRRVFLYNLRLSQGPYRRVILYVHPESGLLVAQQRTVWQKNEEVVKEEFLYDYDQRPDASRFDPVRFARSTR